MTMATTTACPWTTTSASDDAGAAAARRPPGEAGSAGYAGRPPRAVASVGRRAPAADRARRRPYFLDSQNRSANSLVLARNSAANAASEFTLFAPASLTKFQTVSWTWGNFSRCGGLK